MRLAAALSAALLAAGLCPATAGARTLSAGQGGQYPGLAAAVAAAEDGDTISLAPGSYFECASTRQRRLTIEGAADGVVLTDRTCQGKALLVISGDDTTVRNLTLARARVPDGNGAGIRLEAAGLTLERVTFDNDQVGLLAAVPGGTIRIADCSFRSGGVGGDRPLYAVMVPSVAALQIDGSTFDGVAGGQVSSAAERTELRGNTIGDGAGERPAPAVWITAGSLLAEGNTFTMGPAAPKEAAAVMLLDRATAVLRGNRLVNRTGQPMALLRDWSWGTPVMEGNVVGAGDRASDAGGITRHRLSDAAHTAKDEVRGAAGRLRRFVKSLL